MGEMLSASYVGRCDGCGKNLYKWDTQYKAQVGNVTLTFCDRCCSVINEKENSNEGSDDEENSNAL